MITSKQLAIELFKIHKHGDMVSGNEIVYRERDLIEMLTEMGFPKPDFTQLKGEDFQIIQTSDPAEED